MEAASTAAPAARAVELRRLATFDEAAEAQAELARRTSNVFATPEFLATWWHWFGGGRRLELHAAVAGGEIVGLVPLYEWQRRPFRMLRFLGHGAGDQLGVVAEPAARPAIATAVRALMQATGAPVLLGEHLPRDERWDLLLGGRRLVAEGSPVLRFEEASWESYLAARSSNLRQQIRRFERSLARSHGVRFDAPRTPGELERALDALFALHRARWHGQPTNFSSREGFHRDFARTALDRGWARLWSLAVDGHPVAAWYGFRFEGAECYYQMGRDPAWDRARVGFVLMSHTIREAIGDGMEEYRFLRGGEEYKYRLANRDGGLESLIVTDGVRGAAGLAAARAGLAGRRMISRYRRRTARP